MTLLCIHYPLFAPKSRSAKSFKFIDVFTDWKAQDVPASKKASIQAEGLRNPAPPHKKLKLTGAEVKSAKHSAAA